MAKKGSLLIIGDDGSIIDGRKRNRSVSPSIPAMGDVTSPSRAPCSSTTFSVDNPDPTEKEPQQSGEGEHSEPVIRKLLIKRKAKRAVHAAALDIAAVTPAKLACRSPTSEAVAEEDASNPHQSESVNSPKSDSSALTVSTTKGAFIRDPSVGDPWPWMSPVFEYLGHGILDPLNPRQRKVFYRCLKCNRPKTAYISSYTNLKLHAIEDHQLARISWNLLRDPPTGNAEEPGSVEMMADYQPHSRPQKSRRFKKLDDVQYTVQYLPTNHINRKSLDDLTINLVVENGLSFSVVDSDSFGELLRGLSGTKLTRRTLALQLTSRYIERKALLKTVLEEQKHVACTADYWIGPDKRGYLGVMVEWIEKISLTRKSALLACRRMKGSQTAETIAKELTVVFDEYGICEKVTTVIADSGSTLVKVSPAHPYMSTPPTTPLEEGSPSTLPTSACSTVLKDETADESACDEEDEEIAEEEPGSTPVCLDHILESGKSTNIPIHRQCSVQLLVQTATIDLEDILKAATLKRQGPRPRSKSRHLQPANFLSAKAKLQSLWKKLTWSSAKTQDKVIELLGKVLPVPCGTQWNSVYDALSCYRDLEEEKSSGMVALFQHVGLDPLSSEQNQAVRDYVKALRYLSMTMDVLMSDVDLGLIVPLIKALVKNTQNLMAEGSPFFVELCNAIVNSVEDRFKHTLADWDCSVAAALHPMGKLSWEEDQEKKSVLRQHIERLAVEKLKELPSQPKVSPPDSPAAKARKGAMALLTSMFGREGQAGSSALVSEAKAQARAFLDSETTSDLQGDLASPLMRALFMEHNVAMSTGANTRQIFSAGSRLLTPSRCSLSDKHFEASVFLAAEMKLE